MPQDDTAAIVSFLKRDMVMYELPLCLRREIRLASVSYRRISDIEGKYVNLLSISSQNLEL